MPEISVPPAQLYPERRMEREGPLDRLAVSLVAAAAGFGAGRRTTRMRGILADVARQEPALRAMDDARLRQEGQAARAALRARADWDTPAIVQALALARETAARVLGLRPHDEQILAAYAMARGMAVEMATGEGKTLAGSLAAMVGGLAGVPVHVVTVNRYLAERDAEQMGPFYGFLGLSVGVVTEAVPPAERRAQYGRDIVLCTNKDVAFDYLRDRLTMGHRRSDPRRKIARATGLGQAATTVMRGLHFAIIDEADSVLIDEARTPLILSAELPDQRDKATFQVALDIAAGFRAGVHFLPYPSERRIVLLEHGRRFLAERADQAPPWDSVAERERLVSLALTALHTLRRDEHYLVRDGKAEIIDEFSGRVMPDRTWSDGLQEMIECREGLDLTPPRATIARTTYQLFYRRYRRLAGMSGTLHEVAGELWRVYRLKVARIPTHRPDRKRHLPPRAFPTADGKWRAIAADALAARSAGTPVLIGTRTVAASLSASAALSALQVPHLVLNAAQDAAEAAIIARAGEAGAVTVATNMAGRGTDIKPSAEALAAGGLRVIVSEPHEAGRIDRQLAGRCGRQGDPGTVARFVAADDLLIRAHTPQAVWRTVMRLPTGPREAAIRVLADLARRRAERLHGKMRRDLLRFEEWLADAIAFAGESQ